jgi:hypothetical protein
MSQANQMKRARVRGKPRKGAIGEDQFLDAFGLSQVGWQDR